MNNFDEQVGEVIHISALQELLGTELYDDVKKRIADLIVKNVKKDLNHFRKDYYIFAPSDYLEGILRETGDAIKPKLKKMYKDTMLETAQIAVDRFIEQEKEMRNRKISPDE